MVIHDILTHFSTSLVLSNTADFFLVFRIQFLLIFAPFLFDRPRALIAFSLNPRKQIGKASLECIGAKKKNKISKHTEKWEYQNWYKDLKGAYVSHWKDNLEIQHIFGISIWTFLQRVMHVFREAPGCDTSSFDGGIIALTSNANLITKFTS